MIKTVTGLAVAATIAVASLVVPQQAQAGSGGAIAAGLIGGFAAGAIVGSAVAHPYYYGPGPYAYYGAAPVYYGPGCWWRRAWTPNGWRRVRVCR